MANIAGELSEESFAFKEITWKIPNFLDLPLTADYYLDSPYVLLANATWCLRLFPNGQKDDRSDGHVNLYVVRLASSVPKHRVRYKFGLKTRRGKEYQSCADKCTFDHIFNGRGVSGYLSWSKILARSQLLVPDGTATVVCQMRVKILETSKGVRKLQSDYKNLLQSGENSDVRLKVSEKEFRAHRCILRARSTVFSSMFEHDTKEKASGVVVIDDLDPDAFPDFLQHVYAGRVEVLSDDNVFSLYVAADKYDMPELMWECLDYMKRSLSVDNFCDVMALAFMHREEELRSLAAGFFSKNQAQIIATAKWQMFSKCHSAEASELISKALVSGKRDE